MDFRLVILNCEQTQVGHFQMFVGFQDGGKPDGRRRGLMFQCKEGLTPDEFIMHMRTFLDVLEHDRELFPK